MSPLPSTAVRSRPVREPDVPGWLLDRAARDLVAAPAGSAEVRVVVRERRPGPPGDDRFDDTLDDRFDDYVLPPLPAPRSVRPQVRPRLRPDIEGLRGVAVLLVVLHHAGLPWLPGGFVGLDVFFVLSGYLVTSLMVAEVRRDGRVSLPAFYARRARRLLPAAAVVLLASCVAAAVLLPSPDRLDLARDVLVAAVPGGPGTPSADGGASPVGNVGALGAVEQLLLVWPPIFVLALLVARHLEVTRTAVLAVVLTVLTAGSFAVDLHTGAASATTLVAPSRGWQFAVGAWLALLLPVASLLAGRTARAVRSGLGVTGAAALGWAATIPAPASCTGTVHLVPALATAALLAAGAAPSTALPRTVRLLAHPVLRRIGVVSFTWYLWHWPFLVFTSVAVGDPGPSAVLPTVLGSLVAAVLTTRWVERPLRVAAAAGTPRGGLALGLAAIVAPVCTAVVLAAGA